MTDLLNIIFDDFDMWLFSYRVEFSWYIFNKAMYFYFIFDALFTYPSWNTLHCCSRIGDSTVVLQGNWYKNFWL